MDIVERNVADVCVLSLCGRLDAYSAGEVEKRLDSLIEASQIRLVLSLERLDYISSSGLRVFLAELKKVRKKQGDIRLSGMQAQIKEVFDIAGFTQLFTIVATEDAAVSNFKVA